MKSSLARLVVGLAASVAVIIGCQSMYGSSNGGGNGQARAPVLSGVTTTPADPFALATGYFTADSHDLLGGMPTLIEEEAETAEQGVETASHFRAVQIDPLLETTAGPKFVKHFDVDDDGMMDLVTGWNQNQPVQIHLQRRDAQGRVKFVTVNLGGTSPIGVMGGLDMADFNGDGWLDVALAVKETGSVGVCPTDGSFQTLDDAGQGEVQILFSPGNLNQITDGDAWREVRLARSNRPMRRDVDDEEGRTFPEFNGYTGIAAGEIDGINGPDIFVAHNPAKCAFYGDDPNPLNRIVLYANPGGDNVFDSGQIPFSVTAIASGPEGVSTNGSTVKLQGGQSFTRVGMDGLGPAHGAVSAFNWSQVGGPAVRLIGALTPEVTFTAPNTPSTLTFRLDVAAGGESDFDLVTVVVASPVLGPPNMPPTVTASEGPPSTVRLTDQTLVPDADNPGAIMVEMSATAFDPEGDPLTYNWTQVAGEPVILTGATTANPRFAAPKNGSELRFRVTVSDGTSMDSDLVIITSGFWAPVFIEFNNPRVSDVRITDVDLDGDNDVIYTYPDALSRNLAWARNPANVVGAKDALLPELWEHRPVGHVDTYADVFTLGDVDGDGFQDVLVRSHEGGVVQWFRHPGANDREPNFPPPNPLPDRFNFPWQVYTVAEYEVGRVAGLAIGDLTGNNFNEVAVAVGGVVYWYDGSLVGSRYAQWAENFVLDDTKALGTTDDPNDPDFVDNGTVIYNLTIVDLDGDGADDVIATFDRRVNSGLAEDTLIWFRNTIADDGSGIAPAP